MYKFEIPNAQKSIIKVIGVGGGGSNAVNHMYNLGIKDVEFVVCNTDAQALKASPIPNKLQIGVTLTQGLGAGGNPEKGRQAALESKEDVRELLSNNTKMLFITAGMGGGTGTGAAPVIAKMAKEMDILTVAIVTVPFSFEGKKKIATALEGLEDLRTNCDTMLVIMNEKICEIHKNLTLRSAFAQADMVLTNAAKSIAEIITVTYDSNVDFEDVRTVMKDAGAAVMGTGIANGDDRALRATVEALNSPLLNNNSIAGAKRVLVSVAYGEEMEITMAEVTQITDYINEQTGDHDELKFAHVVDSSLGDSLKVTVIVTGFSEERNQEEFLPQHLQPANRVANQAVANNASLPSNVAATRTVRDLDSDKIKQISLFDEFDKFNKSKAQEVDAQTKEQQIVAAPIPPVIPIREPETPKAELQAEQPVSYQVPAQEEVTRFSTPIFEVENPITSESKTLEEKPQEAAPIIAPTTPASSFTWDVTTPQQEQPKVEAVQEAPVAQAQQEVPNAELTEQEAAEHKRRVLMEQARQRIERLRNLSENSNNWNGPGEDYKDKFDTPAYQRKNVNLQDVPHSSERQISRFNLSDDNEILGNNKFLHDNVD